MGTDHDPVRQTLSRNARGKLSRSVINKTIPALLRSDPRARRGVEAVELIVDPPVAAAVLSRAGSTTSGPSPSSPSSSAAIRQLDNQKHKRSKTSSQAGDDIPASVNNDPKRKVSESYEEGRKSGVKPEHNITLVTSDTLHAAYNLFHSHPVPPHLHRKAQPRIAILNMASPLRPGGGVLSGATSQEESLCRRTTLYPSLRDEFYRLPEVGGVYTPDVLVFNSGHNHGHTSARGKKKSTGDDQTDDAEGSEVGEDDDIKSASGSEDETGTIKIDDKKDWFHVDVITAAMLRFPDLLESTGEVTERIYANQTDQELVVQKMRAVMRILRAKGVGQVVLGAWGCGAYGNPVGEIAKAWRKVLLGSSPKKYRGKKAGGDVESYLDMKVVFAIKDGRMAEAFAAAFGPGLLRVDNENAAHHAHDTGEGVDLDE